VVQHHYFMDLVQLYGHIQMLPEGPVPSRVLVGESAERGTGEDNVIVLVPQPAARHVTLGFIDETKVHAAEQQGFRLSRGPGRAARQSQREQAGAASEQPDCQKLSTTDTKRFVCRWRIARHGLASLVMNVESSYQVNRSIYPGSTTDVTIFLTISESPRAPDCIHLLISGEGSVVSIPTSRLWIRKNTAQQDLAF
jgi:hypothetical protein